MLPKNLESELEDFFETDVVAKFEILPAIPDPKKLRLTQKAQSMELKSQLRHSLNSLGISEERQFFSVSHSQFENKMGMIVLGSSQRVGVDLENHQRQVHPKVGSRLIHSTEGQLGLSVLDFWVIKEAVFKCNSDNLGTILSDYRVMSWDSQKRTGAVQFVSRKDSSQSAEFFVKLMSLGSWLVAFAKGK